jgi:hypothetical protein
MKIVKLLTALILSGVLGGCGNMAIKNAPAPIGGIPPAETLLNTIYCSQDACFVFIKVTGDCKFEVPDRVQLSGIPGAIHGVVWIIRSKDYIFSTTGGIPALFAKDSADTFFGKAAVIGRLLAVEVNVSSPGTSHGYGLNIARRAGGACTPIDPFMVE